MNSFTLTPAELYAALLQIDLPQALAAQLSADAEHPGPSRACEGLALKGLAVRSGDSCVVADSVKDALRIATGSPRSIALTLTAQNKPAAQVFYNGLSAITICNRVTPNNQHVFVWLANADEVADSLIEHCLSYAASATTAQVVFAAANATQKKQLALAAQLADGVWTFIHPDKTITKTSALDQIQHILRDWVHSIL